MIQKNSLTLATKELYEHYNNNIGLNDIIDSYNTHKIRHSNGVLEVGRLIFIKSGISLSDELKKQMELALLLHDIGRFHQNNGERILNNNEFEHGNEGEKILKELGYGKIVTLAVKYHNKKDIDELFEEKEYLDSTKEEREDIAFVTYLLRDADKLQNMLYIIFDYKKLVEIDFSKYTKGGISEKVLNDFLNKKLIDNGDVKTDTDYLLSLLARQFDFNLYATHDILQYYNFNNLIIELIKEKNIVNLDVINAVEQILDKKD